MESDIEQQHHRQMNSGLSRYQSAPSSYFTSLVDRKFCEQFVSRPSSPETERIFAQFMTSGSAAEDDRKTENLGGTVKSEAADGIEKYSRSGNLHKNEWRWKPPLPNKMINLGRECSYSMEIMGGNCSTLVRQSSSPAKLLSQINVESGFPYERWEDDAILLDDAKMSENQVRRTRISERIRKLQQLVPNMDKQANTSEMLDLAIDYIKGLQKQVQTLSNNHENCRCSNKQLGKY